jgi:nitrate/TMAO reductase-like tetraheme cytochrome c subunit
MAPAVESWKHSGHYRDADGKMIASCRDCHLPPWSHPFQIVVLKVHHSVKDGVRHFTDKDRLMEASYHAEMKAKARRTMTSSSCLHCHGDIYSTKFYDRDSIHFLVRNIRGSRCLDCHKDLVHDPYPLETAAPAP